MIIFKILTKEVTELLIKIELLDILIKKELLEDILNEITLTKEEETDIKRMIYKKEKLMDVFCCGIFSSF